MPNQVTAGVTPLCAAHLRGRYAAAGASRAFAEPNVGCVGVDLGFARELSRHFELRLRVLYEKPLPPDEEVLSSSLHLFGATLAPEIVVYRFGDRLTVTLGPEVGFRGALLTAQEDRGVPSGFAPGFAAGVVAGIRPWITYHTGFFAEVGAGASVARTDAIELRSGWLGRLTVGWADRF